MVKGCIVRGCKLEAVRAGGAICPFPPLEGQPVGVPVCAVHMDDIGEFRFLPLESGFVLFVYDTQGRLLDMRIATEAHP